MRCPGPMIGMTPTAPRRDYGEARLDEVGGVGARSGGVDGGVFEQPDQFARLPLLDRGDARLHRGERVGIGHEPGRNLPVDRREGGLHQPLMAMLACACKRVAKPDRLG